MDIDAVAPGTDGLDAIVGLAEVEFRSFQDLRAEVSRSSRAARSGTTSPVTFRAHVGLPGGQMELAQADIDPHQPCAGVEEGIAREPKPGHVVVVATC